MDVRITPRGAGRSVRREIDNTWPGDKSGKPEFVIGTKWNKLGVDDGCNLLKTWWPGTESNRRRQPFQGCLPTMLSGSESAQMEVKKGAKSGHLKDQLG